MKDRTDFLRSPRFTAYVSRSPRSRAPDGSFAKRPFRFMKLQGSPAALTLTLWHPFSHLLLASHRRLPASPAASTAAPPWSPPHHPLPRIYLPRRWLSGAPSPGGSPSSPFPAAAVPLLCPPRPQVRRLNPALRGAAAAGSIEGHGCGCGPPISHLRGGSTSALIAAGGAPCRVAGLDSVAARTKLSRGLPPVVPRQPALLLRRCPSSPHLPFHRRRSRSSLAAATAFLHCLPQTVSATASAAEQEEWKVLIPSVTHWILRQPLRGGQHLRRCPALLELTGSHGGGGVQSRGGAWRNLPPALEMVTTTAEISSIHPALFASTSWS
jgi:hypothetical protein